MQDCTDRDITNRQVGDGVVAMTEKALLASLQQSYACSSRLVPVQERTGCSSSQRAVGSSERAACDSATVSCANHHQHISANACSLKSRLTALCCFTMICHSHALLGA